MSNWKTSLAGIIAGLAVLVNGAIQGHAQGGPAVTLGNLLPAAAITILGILAKDANPTDPAGPKPIGK